MAEPLTRFLALGLVVTLLLGACSSDDDDDGSGATSSSSTTTSAAATGTTLPATTTTAPSTTTSSTVPAPEPLEDQTPPEAVNGLTVDGDTLWVASVNSDQIIQVDRVSGAILSRVEAPGSAPDDVAVGPDGAVYWTGFADGAVGRIEGEATETIANVGPGANPLGFTDDGRLVVGRAVTADGLFLVPLDGGEPELVAESVGDMNAFVIDGDRVIGPVGGVLGPGGVNAVDLSTGEVIALGSGFASGVTASAMDPAGQIHLLSANGVVWAFDEGTGTVESAVTLEPGIYDNLDFAPDGTLYVTHFTEPVITAVGTDGTQTTLVIGS